MTQKIQYRITLARGCKTITGQKQVVIVAYQNKKRVQFKTNIRVSENQYSKGLIVNHPLASEYNEYLYNERNKMERIELDLICKGRSVTLQMLKNAVKDNINSHAPFGEFVRAVNEHSSTRSRQTRQIYETLIRQVEKVFGRDVTIEDIDIDWLNRYVEYSKRQRLSINTIIGRLKSLRAIMNEAVKRKVIRYEDDPFLSFRIPSMKARDEYLTQEELRRIERLRLDGRERHIRDCFLFACYTGFRFSDLNTLSQDNIVIIKGKKWIVKKPVKTLDTSSIIVRIPIYSIFGGKALQLIDDYGSVEKLCHIGHNSAANRTLKELLKIAGISEERHITFHVARHTCATLLLSQGVPITSVQSILGHTKITTTQIYAKLIDKTLKKDIEKAFKK